jgi:hypothetical protein
VAFCCPFGTVIDVVQAFSSVKSRDLLMLQQDRPSHHKTFSFRFHSPISTPACVSFFAISPPVSAPHNLCSRFLGSLCLQRV